MTKPVIVCTYLKLNNDKCHLLLSGYKHDGGKYWPGSNMGRKEKKTSQCHH